MGGRQWGVLLAFASLACGSAEPTAKTWRVEKVVNPYGVRPLATLAAGATISFRREGVVLTFGELGAELPAEIDMEAEKTARIRLAGKGHADQELRLEQTSDREARLRWKRNGIEIVALLEEVAP